MHRLLTGRLRAAGFVFAHHVFMTNSTLIPRVDHTWPLHVSMSADGRYIVFANYFALEQANLVAEGTLDVFRVDAQTGQIQMVSGPHGPGLSAADMLRLS
jgi:6-phosphogluconolactonase (cycloisomerase 2 family)